MANIIKDIFGRITGVFSKGDQRSVLVKKNIAASFLLRGISILVSFVLVPLTIDYVDSAQYGIWLTLSQLLMWFNLLDLGVAMSLRNLFAETKARGDVLKGRQYISTAYASISCIAIVIMAVAYPLFGVIDWSSVLNVDASYRVELTDVMQIILGCFALMLVVTVMSNILIGDQLTGVSSLIGVIGQVIILVVVIILVNVNGHGSLVTLAFLLSGIPAITLLIGSVILFMTRYKQYVPSLSYVKPSLVKELIGMGGKFFFISISTMLIFQMMNVIITRELGPVTVTEYNVSFKYFNIVHTAMMLMMFPFWAATTDAYTRGNYRWIFDKTRSIERMMLKLMLPAMVVMLAGSQVFYKLWVGDQVQVSWTMSIVVAIYNVAICASNVYTCLISGIGKIKLQLYVYVAFAIIAYPVMTYSCRYMGIPGLVLFPTIVYVVQSWVMRKQMMKILTRRARGIWNE